MVRQTEQRNVNTVGLNNHSDNNVHQSLNTATHYKQQTRRLPQISITVLIYMFKHYYLHSASVTKCYVLCAHTLIILTGVQVYFLDVDLNRINKNFL